MGTFALHGWVHIRNTDHWGGVKMLIPMWSLTITFKSQFNIYFGIKDPKLVY